jgi:hypothetical protein
MAKDTKHLNLTFDTLLDFEPPHIILMRVFDFLKSKFANNIFKYRVLPATIIYNDMAYLTTNGTSSLE